VSVKYRELGFRSEEEREKAVRYIMENAEASLPGTRVVRIGKATFRVSLHQLKGQYFLVFVPRRKEILLPRIWLVAIPGFKLCEIPIGREMKVCNRRVVSVAVDDHELIYVCDYHGSGFRVFSGVMDRQLKPVPPGLCIRFCPQSIRTGFRSVLMKKLVKKDGEEKVVELLHELPVYECRAFMSYASDREEAKRSRSYKGMYLLCVEDFWWRRYLRRHKLERA